MTALWTKYGDRLVSEVWEDLCRDAIPRLGASLFGCVSPSGAAQRYWRGNGPEWNPEASSLDDDALLLGEIKWSGEPFSETEIEQAARELLAKGAPHERWEHGRRLEHVVFVPRLAKTRRGSAARSFCKVVTAEDILAALR